LLGCHIEEKEGKGELEQTLTGKTFKASNTGCVKCHGEKYAALVDDWKKELNAALTAWNPG